MQNIRKLLAVAGLVPFLLTISSGPAEAKWSGNVRKTESRRLTRPLQDFADVGSSQTLTPSLDKADGTLNALVNENQFGIGVNSGQAGQGASAAIDWPERLNAKASSFTLPARTDQAGAQIDYAAIEQAYADAVPRHPVISSAQATGANVSPNLVATAAGNRARLQELQNGRPGAGAGVLDLDNCACDTVIPTAGCMQSRTIGLYAPNNGTVAPPAMHSPLAPAAALTAAQNMQSSHLPGMQHAAQNIPGAQLPGMPAVGAAPGAMQLGIHLGR